MGFLDLIFPKSCLNCGKPGKYFCELCLSKVHTINHFDPISKTFSIFAYEGVIKKGITKIKYNFAFDLAAELSQICASQILNSKFTINNTILTPIPLHPSRKRWRGFNQSEVLGKIMADKLSWQFKNDLLIRSIQGKNQVGLKRSDRVRNIRGKFTVNPEAKNITKSSTYIVFDDVMTTGSTIKEAIKVLKRTDAKKVFGLTIAR